MSGQTFECFCQEPCKTYEYKNQDGSSTAWVKCGTKIDYKVLFEQLKPLKNHDDKEGFLKEQRLGCVLNLKEEDYLAIDPDLWQFDPRAFPQCNHNIFAKMGISHSENNTGRTFFSCSVTYPNIPCDYFAWGDECIDGIQEQEHIQQERETYKRRKQEENIRPWKKNKKSWKDKGKRPRN